MRCINQDVNIEFDYNWYNLYYDLTDISTRSVMDPMFCEFLLNYSVDEVIEAHRDNLLCLVMLGFHL